MGAYKMVLFNHNEIKAQLLYGLGDYISNVKGSLIRIIHVNCIRIVNEI